MIYKSEQCFVASISFLFCFLTVSGTSAYHKRNSSIPRVGDAGEPLFITPLLEKGEFEKARLLAKVQPLAGHLHSYAGFLTVDKAYDSNHFFWFFPAFESPEKAPVVVWLQGGPGASSLFGLFSEHGPYALGENEDVYLRQYAWTKTMSMLYIDNPVGAGFSFTKQDKGYCTSQEEVAKNLYSTIAQFFKLFPELLKNELYVAGESYGGKYAPALAYAIHQRNSKASEPKINLKGIAIGNGYSDPINMMGYGEYLYQIGLIDTATKKRLNAAVNKVKQLIRAGRMEEASVVWSLMGGEKQNSPTLFFNVTGFRNYYNYLSSSEVDTDSASRFVQRDYVRKKIHVGKLEFHESSVCKSHLKRDIMRSVAPWIGKLLNSGYKFLVYNGQVDICVPYPLTVEFLRKLHWSGAREYRNAARNVWRVEPGDKEVAGYVRVARNLVEVMVRNAGHMVPCDQPRVAYDLINRFVFDKKFD